MGKRREGRQAAIQYLFAHDLHGEVDAQEMKAFWQLHSASPAIQAHAEALVRAVNERRKEIDEKIASTLDNFKFERLGHVDRNILRVAVYELIYTPDVPVPVVINEAVEIAKIFGDTQTKAFVNGVLDKIGKATGRKAKNEAPSSPISDEA